MKVVGVGSVGTLCAIGLLFAAEGDALFLQVKQVRAVRPRAVCRGEPFPSTGSGSWSASA